MSDGFVNPYTFVPFPGLGKGTAKEAFRSAPAGHAYLGEDRFAGRVDVKLTTRSPLLVRDQNGHFPHRPWSDASHQVPFVPGSGIKGAVRSLHETVVGGCARVFDEEFLPVYRDPARSRGDDWTLAYVEEADEHGRPVELRLCSSVERRPAHELIDALGSADEVVTGKRMPLPQSAKTPQSSDDDHWVLLVTDSKVWEEQRENDPKSPEYTCALGKLSDTVLRWSDEAEWDASWAAAWEEYLRRVEGTEDMRLARQKPQERTLQSSAPVSQLVQFDGHKVGWRHESRPALFRGQVVWIKPSAEGVAEFALSVIWRHSGGGPARNRIPDEFLPCSDPSALCPTCRVFGSVDTTTRERRTATQEGYAGHVRFSEAVPTERVEVEPWQLPPLGAPNPGAGAFYLNTTTSPGVSDDLPKQEWREGDGRNLRGRKYYWLTEDHDQRPLFRVQGNLTSELATTGEALPSETCLSTTVWFENLTESEVGGLLAALNPALVLPPQRDGAKIGLALGGARPFGFGTCTSEITSLRMETATSRYRNDRAPDVTVDSAVRKFQDSVLRGVKKRWGALAKALTLDWVLSDRVWYPTDQPLPHGPLTPADLEQDGFQFWKHASDDESLSLPLIGRDGHDEEQPIRFDASERKQRNKQGRR